VLFSLLGLTACLRDLSKTRRPEREVQRVNLDFPVGPLRAIDREATRIGVTGEAFIKRRGALWPHV
jgi:hypothetical protein